MQGNAESRSIAQRLIREGQVMRADGSKVAKPSQKLAPNEPLMVASPPRFVSRGGEKLQSWFDAHPMNVNGWRALDVGSSTGGFTDCLLQQGVCEVTGIDVGHGQLHARIAEDPRVINLEGINARDLPSTSLPHRDYQIVVADLSFISLKLVLDAIWDRLAPDGVAIFLVKPQFEAPRSLMAKTKGVLRDEQARQDALSAVLESALALPHATLIGQLECPIAGGDGNREYFVGLKRQPQ